MRRTRMQAAPQYKCSVCIAVALCSEPATAAMRSPILLSENEPQTPVEDRQVTRLLGAFYHHPAARPDQRRCAGLEAATNATTASSAVTFLYLGRYPGYNRYGAHTHPVTCRTAARSVSSNILTDNWCIATAGDGDWRDSVEQRRSVSRRRTTVLMENDGRARTSQTVQWHQQQQQQQHDFATPTSKQTCTKEDHNVATRMSKEEIKTKKRVLNNRTN